MQSRCVAYGGQVETVPSVGAVRRGQLPGSSPCITSADGCRVLRVTVRVIWSGPGRRRYQFAVLQGSGKQIGVQPQPSGCLTGVYRH